MRRKFFILGWIVFFTLPILFTIEIVRIQNIPDVQPWQWAILAATVVLLYFTRDRDEAMKHHLPH